MNISIVIPLLNEEESLRELCEWIERVMKANQFTYEVIFVDDGSTDNSWKLIEELSDKNQAVKGLKFRRNYGKSPALNIAFEAAQGDVVITMDADHETFSHICNSIKFNAILPTMIANAIPVICI